jgi:hypothetical protein
LHAFRRFIKHSSSLLCAANLTLAGAAAAELELVMQPGMTITAATKAGVIAVTAGHGLKRTYAWKGGSHTVALWPRPERWYGSLGAYYSSFGDDWPLQNGITRGVLEEGQQHFESERQALDWLQKENRRSWTVYCDDGLVVSYDQFPHRTLGVEVWQLFINGEKPKKLPGSSNDKISVTHSKAK